jgi:PIN domain nuclease of toxin-antitoxin system
LDLLLDTHAFLWWIAGDESLSLAARDAIGDAGMVLVSNEQHFDAYGVRRLW